MIKPKNVKIYLGEISSEALSELEFYLDKFNLGHLKESIIIGEPSNEA